jgi:predicted PurR-regulated permease PerM
MIRIEPQAVNKLLKQVLLLSAVIALLIIILLELGMFLKGLMGALALHVVLRKPYYYLTKKRGWNKYGATMLILFGSALLILVPIVWIGILFKNQFEVLVVNYPVIVEKIEDLLRQVEKYLGFQLLSDEATQRMAVQFAQMLPEVLSSTAGSIVQLMFVFFLLYFTLSEAVSFEAEARKLLPFKPHNNAMFLKESRRMTISNIVGIPMVAVVQAVTALISYLIVSSNDAILLSVLTGIASVIPIVGTALVWLPFGAYLLGTGEYWQGAFIILYGMFIVTNIDNLARMMLQKRMADIHPLITIIGVIVGINIFGFIGLIFGPLIVSYLFVLLKIYRNEFIENHDQDNAATPGSSLPSKNSSIAPPPVET